MKRILIAAFVTVMMFSCRKGELPPEQYQAGLVVKSSQLSTSSLDVKIDGISTGESLTAGNSIQQIFELSGAAIREGKKTNLKIYKTGVDQPIADTNVLIRKGELPVFNVIYSDDLGMGGIINGTDVPLDSIRIRVAFHDHTAAKRFTKLQLEFYQFSNDYPYYNVNDNVSVILNLDENKYSGDFYIPLIMKDGITPTHLFVGIKDPSTGNYLNWWPDLPSFETNIDAINLSGGSYCFFNYNVLDNIDAGAPDFYMLEANLLQL